MAKRILHYIGILFGIGVFGAAIWVLQHALRDLRWERLMDQLSAIPLSHVFLAVLFTALAYLILTVYDTTAFAYIGRRVNYLRVAFVSFLSYAFSHSLGFGSVTGSAVRYRFYSAWGVRPLDIGKVILFGGSAYILGAVAVAGLLMLINADEFTRATPLPIWAVNTLGVLFVLVGCSYLGWSAAGKPPIQIKNACFPPPRLRLCIAQLSVGCLEWGFASAALYWLLPIGIGVDYWHFVGIFVVAYLSGMVSNVPGGLGVFESVIILLLPEHIAADDVVAAIITYRAVYFVLPLLVAACLFAIYEIRQGHVHIANLNRLLHPFRRRL